MTDRRPFIRFSLWTLLVLAAGLVLALLAAAVLLPGWITGRGAALATAALGREVRIEHASVQPWRLGVVLDGLSVAGPGAGQPPLLQVARLDTALSLRSLFRGHLVVSSVRVTRPELRVARLAEGHYDIDDLIRQLAPQPGAAEGPSPGFAVYNIEVVNGLVAFDDRPVQRRHELADLHLALPFVSTLADDVAIQVAPHLGGRLDGVPFDSQAQARPFGNDTSARLAFRLAGLDLAPLGAYVPAGVPVRLTGGRLDLDLALDFAQHAKQPPALKLSGSLQLQDLSVASAQGQPLLELKRLSLPLVDVQPLRRQLAFGQIQLDVPHVWFDALPTRQAGAPAAEPAGPAAPWQVSVAGLALQHGQLQVADLGLDAIDLQLGSATWPLKAPTQLDASLRLDRATLTARARLAPDLLEADAELTDLPLERLAGWLPLPGRARLAAVLSTKAHLAVTNPLVAGAADRVQVALAGAALQDLRLSLPSVARPVLTLARAELDEARAEFGTRHVTLGRLRLDTPRAQLARDPDGRLDIGALLPPASASAAPASAAGPGWTLQAAGVDIDRGALRWRDAAVAAGVAPVAVVAEPIRLRLGALSWPASAAVQTEFSSTLASLRSNDQVEAASAGSLQWHGSLALAPLGVRGSLQARAVPLQLFNAYLDPAWGLQLQRAELGMKADVSATQQAGGAWAGTVGGEMRLGPLALLQPRQIDGAWVPGETLLSWQALQLDGLQLSLSPGAAPSATLREAALEDAYARLIVDEQGRFNLRDIGRAEAAAPAASAASASAPAPVIAVERVRLSRGLVDFNDRFVQPHYSARLSELQGSLGSFSTASPAMAPLTLRGKVAGTGLLEIDGQLKPGAPMAMDIAAHATDIELAPLSPYAGKYAGYAIERGKLSTRLHYQVEPGGRLSASNQIILNQLTFGDKVESPDATTLPVRFAVALLKDRDGVIDINLPISGSLSDPEFSVGGIVWKLLLNMVGKALTSPFALFSGSESSQEAEIAFLPGGAELGDTAKLDRIAQLLADKPGVRLTLTGWAAPQVEAAAIRELRLARALKAENDAVPAQALRRLYQATPLPNKPRNLIGLTKELPPEQMRELLLASYAVDADTLHELAVARAVAVRDALLARGAPNGRVFLAAPKFCDVACEAGWQPHVELSLGAH